VLILSDVLQDLGLAYRYLPSTESTNDDARTWLDEGAADMSIVIADEQTKGRGRFERKWHTRAGAALASSLVILPTEHELDLVHLFSPMTGIAVAATLEKLFGLHPQIKWPNDILLSGKKVCGILSESAWIGSELKGVVIGTGINITSDAIPPGEMMSLPATCVEAETGYPVDRWLVLREYLTQMFHWRTHLGNEHFFHFWRSHLAYLGEEVEIQGNLEKDVTGILEGVAENGDLLIRSGQQRIQVRVGDVHLRLRPQ